MSHDESSVAKRSSSHGALNGLYSLPTRASSAILESSHHLVPHFKPLRSIREHGHTFLDPAASADGMLRKTTETGNIGLFSIKTGRPTTALHPRASLGDLRQPHRPISRSSDRPSAHDDRKRLPLYRDSTSEIISMYGSDNQSSAKSVSGTLSPPWDEVQRSYSMTTCGSKSYTLPRSMGMLHAQDVHAGAQRPRSPYPYPTRLPRPGIRPSSPALTENGSVDYSRMVEIDRIPQRTIHHPHKPLFPYKTTRDQPAAPLSIRYGANQSTHSLSDDCGPTRVLRPPMPRRPLLPNHLHPWGLRPRHRLGSESSDQSLRTMSLTSTNGGFAWAPLQPSNLQIPEKKAPIFYDYSEDFEDAVEPPPDLPIASPTPTRVSTSFRPGIPDEDCDGDDGSESADEAVDHMVDYMRRMTMIESVGDQEQDEDQEQESHEGHGDDYNSEHCRPVSHSYQRRSPAPTSFYEPVGEPLASSPVLPMVAHTVDNSDVSVATLGEDQFNLDKGHQERLNRTMESIGNGLVSEASTVESPPSPDTPTFDMEMSLSKLVHRKDDFAMPVHGDINSDELSNIVLGSQTALTDPDISVASRPDLPDFVSATLPNRYSSGRKDSRFFSLSSGLSDLASFVNCVDKHIQSLECEVERDVTPVSGSRSEDLLDHGRPFHQNVEETAAPPRKSSLANQRFHIVPQVNTAAPVDELGRYQVVSTRSGPTLVPQPISPAKMLRLKNSIPQLMKCLPPLPSYSPASESPFNPTIVPVEFEPFEFSRLTDARSTLIEGPSSQSQEGEVPEEHDPFVFDRPVRKPKLKLKTAASHTLGNVRRTRPRHIERGKATLSETTDTKESSTGDYSTAPVKRRLPIKLSRPMLESLALEDTGTVKRRHGVDKSSTVSELASSQPVDLFTLSSALEMAVQPLKAEQSPPSDREYGTLPVVKATPMVGTQRVTVTDEGRGASLDTQLDALHSPRTRTETAVEDRIRSAFSDSITKPQRGLRKRLSNLKSRLTESRHQHAFIVTTTVCDNKGGRAATGSQSPHAIMDLHAVTSSTQSNHIVTSSRTVRSKWGRLVQGAKQRLRIWGKNRHKDE